MEFVSKKLTVNELLNTEVVGYELYRHDKQKGDGWIVGFDLENHLRDTGLINRALSLESELVKGWLANPSTYPEKLKGIYPCLWGSARGRVDYRNVPYLFFVAGAVHVDWRWLGGDFYRFSPALLASVMN